MATFTLTTGADNFTGLSGEDNTFNFTPTTLQAGDGITGGATGSFIDILALTASGTITAGQFAGVTNIEQLRLSGGGNNVTLANGLVAGAAGGIFSVFDGAGSDVVNASGITNGTRIVFFASGGSDTLTGGTAADSFVFSATDLASADTVQGGAGTDTLILSSGGTIAGGAFANASGIEALNLSSAGNTVTLTDGLIAGSGAGFFSVVDGGGNDVVDASGATGGGSILFFAAGGNDTLTGNSGNNSFVFAASDLTSADTVQANGGIDTLVLSAGGVLASNALANVTGIETLLLSNGGNTVTLTNGVVASSGVGFFQVFDGTGNDTVDASGVTNGTPVIFFSAGGNDTLLGGNGPDSFVFSASDLTSADTVSGGAGFDTLWLSSSGTVSASAFANVSGIETLALAPTGSNVTLNNSLVGTSTLGFFQVAALGGTNTVDASGVTNGTTIVYYGGPGNDSFTGSGGNDTFIFARTNLTSADTVVGGTGADMLLFNAGGTASAASLAGVSGIETVWQQVGGTVQFANGLSNTGDLLGLGSSAVDNFDGSGVTSYKLTLQSNGGADTLIGGSQDDSILISDSTFTTVDGNGGLDPIVLSAAGQNFDLTANASRITDVEVISLASSLGATLSLTNTDIPQVNASGNSLYVVGGSDDEVLVGDTWTVVTASHTNSAVAAGVTFVHYHNATTNSDLFIADTIPTTISTATNNAPTILLDGSPSGLNPPNGANHSASYTTGNSAGAAIADTIDASIDDPDPADSPGISAHITQLVANLTDPHSGALEFLTLTSTGQSFAAAHGVTVSGLSTATLTLGGSATDQVYQELLREIRYVNTDTGASLNTSDRHITVNAQDGLGAAATTRTATISLISGNDAPVANGDSATTAEDTPLTYNVLANDTDADNDDLTVTAATVVGGSGVGTVSINPDKTITFTPAANYSGPATVNYAISDGHGGTSSASLNVTVTAANDTPVAAADSLAAVQDGPAAIGNLLTNDSDIEDGSPMPGNVTAFSVAGVGAGVVNTPLALGNGATLNVAANGAVTLTQNNGYDSLANGQTALINLSYTVTDAGGASDNASATITVTGVNDPLTTPATITDPVLTEDLDTVASDNVLDDVTDPDVNDVHIITAVVAGAAPGVGGVGGPVLGTYGTLTIDANGEAQYELNNAHPDVQALNTGSAPLTDTFTYTVSDQQGSTGSTTITFNVNGTNDGPVAVTDGFSVNEDAALAGANVLTNDTDIDLGDGKSVVGFTAEGQPAVLAGGTITLANGAQLSVSSTGAVTLTQNSAYNALANGSTANVVFSYTMQDTAGAQSTAGAAIQVNGVNDAPAGADKTVTIAEDAAHIFTVSDFGFSDVDLGSALAFVKITTLPTNGQITLNGTPVTLAGTDVSAADIASGLLRFVPDAHENNGMNPSYASFTFQVGDGIAFDGSPNLFTVSVTAVNDTPVANADTTFTTPEDTQLIINLLANDTDVEDGTPVAIARINGTAIGVGGTIGVIGGTVTLNVDQTLTFNPTPNSTTDAFFTYTAKDSAGVESNQATVSIDVTPENDGPTAAPDGFSTPEDTAVTFDVRANDTDIDSPTLTVTHIDGIQLNVGNGFTVTLGDGATVHRNANGTLTYTPALNAVIAPGAPPEFSYTVSDGLLSSTATVNVTVTAVNDTPVAASDSLAATQDGAAAIGNLLTNDSDVEDGTPIPGNVTAFTVAGVGAGVVNTPLALGNGATLNVAANGAVTLTQNNAYDYLGTGDTTQISLTYTVTDSGGASDSSSAVIIVTGVNDLIGSPPTASVEVTEDLVTQVTSNVFDNVTDADLGDVHTVTAVVTGATPGVGGVGTPVAGTYGTLTIGSNGEAHYQLNNSLPAVQALNVGSTPLTDTFTYTVSDGPSSASTTITFEVHGTNDGPVAVFDFLPTTEDAAPGSVGNVLTNDTDVDTSDGKSVVNFTVGGTTVGAGSTITLGNGAQISIATNGTVTFTQNGAYNFVGQGNTAGLTFNYTMQDTAGAVSSDSGVVSISGVNDAPVAQPNTFTINEDSSPQLNVLGNDTDVDGPFPLAVARIDGNTVITGQTVGVTGGTVTVNGNGTLTFTPTANLNGPGVGLFTYTAKDGLGTESAAAQVTVDVTAVNDAPTPTNDTFNVNENGPAAIGNLITANNGNGIDSDVETLSAALTVDGIRLTGTNSFTSVPPAGSATLTFANGAQVQVDSAGNVTFLQNASFESLAAGETEEMSFQYRLRDTGDGASAALTANANVRIVVTGVNDAPAGTDKTVTIAEDGAYVFAVSDFGFSDVDAGSALAFVKITTLPTDGQLTLNGTPITIAGTNVSAADIGNGLLRFVPDANENDATNPSPNYATFTFQVGDGTVFDATPNTFTISVTAVNDAPEANLDALTVAENGPSLIGNVLGNDTDVDGPNVEVTSFTILAGGSGTFTAGQTATLANGATLTVDEDGTVTLVQGTAYDYLGAAESAQIVFSYDITDNGSPAQGSGSGATITVNGVNEAPTLTLGSAADLLETASSSPVGVAVAAAAAAVTDEEQKIKTIEINISSGYQDGTATTLERAQLTAVGQFGLGLLGGSPNFVDNGNNGTLTLSFATPITAAQATSLLKQIEYVNQYGDFSLQIALDDTRTVSVRVQDHSNVWSTTETRTVNIAADVVDGAGNGTFVGGRFNDIINGADGNDTLTGAKGDDSLIGGNNTATGDTVNYAKETDAGQVSETGTQGVIVNLSDADYDLDGLDPIYNNIPNNDDTILAGRAVDTYDTHDTLSGIENVVGTSHDDIFISSSNAGVANTFEGGGTGPLAENAANEVGGDTVVFGGTLGDWGIQLQPGGNGDDFTVTRLTGPNAGTVDTLNNIENIVVGNTVIDLTNTVWVYNNGFLVNTYSSIGAAVAAANGMTPSGTGLVVEAGHNGGTTYNESAINITQAMTVRSLSGVTVNSTDGVDLFVVSATSGTVTFENLNLVDGAGTDYGIRMAGAHATGSVGTADLVVTNVDIGGFDQTGLFVNGGGTGRDVTITGSDFTGNGGNGSSGGTGDILFFEYTGNASLSNVTVTGTTGMLAGSADHGIQFAGFRDSDDAITSAIGTVSFNNVTVTGTYEKTLTYIQGYNNLSGVSFTDTTIGSAGSSTTWTGLFVEPDSTSGPLTLSGSTSNLDLSDVTFAGTYGWQTTFQLPGANLILGTLTNDSITGSAFNDAIRTLTGTDTINAGLGNDLTVYDVLPGSNKHTVDGQGGDDTQVVIGTGAAETYNVNAVNAGTMLGINITAGSPNPELATAVNSEVITDNVEDIVIQTGNGGDTVIVSGDLAGTGVSTSTITVVGGTGNDTVDASTLTSVHGIDFTGAGGNDTFVSSNAGGNDRFDGGIGGTDTVRYDFVTTNGVIVDLQAQTATGAGSDTLIDVENVNGTDLADTISGDGDANQLAGFGGFDTLQGRGGVDALIGGETETYTAAVGEGDRATYAGELTAAAINTSGPGWQVATGGAEGTDTLEEIEIVVDGSGDRFLLVGNGGFASINDAIAEAQAGDTIVIAAGTYAKNVVIDKAVTLIGKGLVTIDPAAGVAVTLGGNIGGGNVTIDNVDIVGGTDGISVATTANAGKLTVTNSAISGNSQHGIFFIGDDPNDDGNAPIVAGITALDLIGVAFANNGFQNNLNGSGHIKLFGYQGDALFQNVTITGAPAATPTADRPDNAIEITGYVNNGSGNPVSMPGAPNIGSVVFDGVTVSGEFHKNPVAIFNFSELDGLSIPAGVGLNLSAAVSDVTWGPLFNLDGIEDAVIDASGYNITFPVNGNINTELQGEKSSQDTVDQTITGTVTNDRMMGKLGNDTLFGGAGNDELYGADKPGGSPATVNEVGDDNLFGESGLDTLKGGRGNDDLSGGETGEVYTAATGEGDKAIYDAAITRSMITEDGLGGWTVTTGGLEGTDMLTGVEIVDGAEAGRFLLVGNGGFATFADAYTEAVDGDTIVLAAGTYTGTFTISKAITVSGANHNVAGDGLRGAESVIDGNMMVDAAGAVTIEGLRFLNDEAATSPDATTLKFNSAAGHTVRNSVFFSTIDGGDQDPGINPMGDLDPLVQAFAIEVSGALTSGSVTIDGNYVTGAPFTGKFGTAAWHRGVSYDPPGGVTLTITDNTFEFNRTGINTAGTLSDATGTVTISGNTFKDSGSGVTLSNASGLIEKFDNNVFTNVDTDLNGLNLSGGYTFNAGANGNSATEFMVILGGGGVDTITGTTGKDAILGNDSADTIATGDGDDAIFWNVGDGSDGIDGGEGAETNGDTLVAMNRGGSSLNPVVVPEPGAPASTITGGLNPTAATFNVNASGGNVTLGVGAHTVTADNIEHVRIEMGTGGDTVNVSGDFNGTDLSVSTITVTGGTGNDTVNASGLTSNHRIVFNGGAGDDTFVSSNAGGNDTFAGGTDGLNGDTVNYSAITGGGVNVDLQAQTATNNGGSNVGSDTLTDVEDVVGTAQGDSLAGDGDANLLQGLGGDDTLTGRGGADRLEGSSGTDTAGYEAVLSSAATFGVDVDGHWTITIASVTDTLVGVERVTFADKTFLLVDKEGVNVGGYQTVQSAIDAAAGGETILIRGGETYSETSLYVPGDFQGIYINKPNLTLQGTAADGSLIITGADAQTNGPTIVAAAQNMFGANHWVDINGDNTTFSGVHLKAGPETDNKVLEFWANNVTVQNSFVDAYNTLGVYTFAVAIYINDNGTTATDEVTAYTIDGNILNEGIIVANGVGDPSLGISANQKITDNQFIDAFNLGTGLGRYDTIVINGQVNGIGWLLEPTQTPTITGNTVANNTVPFILRGSDNSAANLPSSAQIAVILANNFDANVSYAYVVDSTTGELVLASRNDGGGPYRSFAVTNTIDTLNLALDTTADNVFGGQRDYIHSGDTIIVQSGAGAPVELADHGRQSEGHGDGEFRRPRSHDGDQFHQRLADPGRRQQPHADRLRGGLRRQCRRHRQRADQHDHRQFRRQPAGRRRRRRYADRRQRYRQPLRRDDRRRRRRRHCRLLGRDRRRGRHGRSRRGHRHRYVRQQRRALRHRERHRQRASRQLDRQHRPERLHRQGRQRRHPWRYGQRRRQVQRQHGRLHHHVERHDRDGGGQQAPLTGRHRHHRRRGRTALCRLLGLAGR